jgi:hypothetical protein
MKSIEDIMKSVPESQIVRCPSCGSRWSDGLFLDIDGVCCGHPCKTCNAIKPRYKTAQNFMGHIIIEQPDGVFLYQDPAQPDKFRPALLIHQCYREIKETIEME